MSKKDLEKLLKAGTVGEPRKTVVRLTTYERGDQGSVVFIGDELLDVYEVFMPTRRPMGACCSSMYVKMLMHVAELDGDWYVLQSEHGDPPFRISFPADHEYVKKRRESGVTSNRVIFFEDAYYLVPEAHIREVHNVIKMRAVKKLDKKSMCEDD